jgi:hypothetical protein
MTEVEKRPTSARTGTTEVKKDPFKFVPDNIDELGRDGLTVVNRYRRGAILGKVCIFVIVF